MEDIDLFTQWNEVIFKTQAQNDLVDLYHVRDTSSGSCISEVLSTKKQFHPVPYSIFKLHDEFIVISKDLKYATGILFFLRPYIVNTDDTGIYYHQTLADRRYLQYCTYALQSVYQFWDRLGDLIHYYFPTNIKLGLVYFGQVIDRIEDSYKTIESYGQLKALYHETKELLNLRHDAVHQFQIETRHYWGHIQYVDDETERTRINSEKFSYPDKMKKALHQCNEAFFTALDLLKELPDDPEIIALREGSGKE